jgi:Family of unknown function (DUF6476)
MRFLKFITVAMAMLIVVGTTVLLVVIVRRIGSPAVPAQIAVLLDEPAGTRIAGVASVGDRLAVRLEGGGADRVVLLDARTGVVAGRIGLRAGGL